MTLCSSWRRGARLWYGWPLAAAMLSAVACAQPPVPMAAHSAMLMVHPAGALAQVMDPADRPADTTDGAAVDIHNFQFSVPTLTVPVGTTVTWTNRDTDEHTVTANDRSFSSTGLDPGETFSHRFDTPGTYAYHCALHPQMTAQIVVQ